MQSINRKTAKTLMLCLNETIDQLAISNSGCWCCHVSKREDVCVLRKALDFEVEGQSKNRLKRSWKKQVDKESMKV